MQGLMHAFLITGSTKDQRAAYIAQKQKEWNVSTFDCVRLAGKEESIGIAHIRDIGRQLQFSPYNSPKKLAIIEDAQTMTPEAQNAILKTLEEPPPKTVLFLECPTQDALLPTIVSRCSVVNLGIAPTQNTETLMKFVKTVEHIATQPIGERIAITDEIAKTREDAKRWVNDAIIAMREAMLSQYQGSIQPAKTLRTLLTGQSQLNANVTPKLVIDHIIFSL